MTWRRRARPWAVAAAAMIAVLVVRAIVVDAPLDRLRRGAPAVTDPPGTAVWTGTLWMPRGGPARIGFASPGPARLELDGRPPITGRGVVTPRLLVTAGPIGLRFAAPPGARLVWHPPGRTGDPEYVPASSLSPAPPAEARWRDAGTARGDALAAWALFAIAAGLALYLRRDRVRAWPRAAVVATAAVFVLAAVVRLWDLGAAGQTWDEDTYFSAGRNYVQNWLRGDFDDAAWRWNYEHPPISKYLAGLGGLWTEGFAGARAVAALMMAAACALVVAIGRRLFDLRVGAIAGGIAALSPHLIAHGQIVGHEAPSVCWWALAWWSSARVWDGGHDRRALVPRLVAVGVVVGLAAMTRFVNVLMTPAIAVTILAAAPPAARRRAIGYGLVVIPLAAIVTSIVVWPRLWTHPIAHLTEAWDKLKGTHSKEPFWGELTATPPRWYFLPYLAATSPLGVVVAMLGGAAVAAARHRRALLVIAAWTVAPLAVALSPVRQDGIRYVLPVLVPFALLAAIGLGALGDAVAARTRRWVASIPAALIAIYLVITCARIHPYYLDYYGEHVGGTAGVARARRFEVAWWGEGLAAAIAYVDAHAAPGDRVHRDCVEPGHLTWFRGDLWEPVPDPRQAAWIVHYQPSWRPCAIPPDARRVFRVTAGGAPLADVYHRGP